MESSDQYNFSIFRPRNLHGKKNRNVILTMLLIWAVAVFGFQFLLRGIEKPTPEKALTLFESTWPAVVTGELSNADYKTFLYALVLVKGKSTIIPGDQKVLSDAISCVAFTVVPDSVRILMISNVRDLDSLKSDLVRATDQEYLGIKTMIAKKNISLAAISESYSGFKAGSLEASIFTGSLHEKHPESLGDPTLSALPGIMKFYLTHNQSKLTDTRFLGFPFHYFYTAVFLLILFIALCIVYNILIEWRLGKEGIVE
ncbi:MAG TPA: hypothetical protein VJ203_04410 [Bacteroidales bacterium]|nr:hypothetical protein [Bacteroidales bacterium]